MLPPLQQTASHQFFERLDGGATGDAEIIRDRPHRDASEDMKTRADRPRDMKRDGYRLSPNQALATHGVGDPPGD